MCSKEKHDIFFRHENTDFLSERCHTVLGGTDVKHDIMCHDIATLKNCKTIRPKVSNEAEMLRNPWIRYFDQISARPNRAPYPSIRSCNSVQCLNFSSNSHIWMEHLQKVTNINHVKFDIHTLDNMEVTRTFMFNLHIQTILPKIMWDKLAECTASTIDQFFTWKQTLFGPNPTFPPSPHTMLFVRKGLPTSRPILHRGWRGERANIAAIREKDTLSHTFWPGLSISRTFTTNAYNSKCMESTVSKFVWVKFVHVFHTSLTSRLWKNSFVAISQRFRGQQT